MDDFIEPVPLWARMICYGAGFLLVCGSIAYFIWGAIRASEAPDWPTVEGVVLAAGVDAQTEESDDDDDFGTTTTFYPRVRYRYTVAGVEYVNDAVWLNAEQGYSNSYDADEVVGEFAEGGAVRVYYDPDDPADSALMLEGMPWFILIATAMGIPWIAVGWFLGPRNRRRQNRRDPLMGAPRI